MSLKRLSVASAAVLLAVASPAAADGPAYAKGYGGHATSSRCGSGPFSGTYIGANLGLISSDSDHLTGDKRGHSETSNDGVSSGIFGGRNWQCGGHVWGIEADMGFGGSKTTAAYTNASASSATDWYSTVRGRIGVADDDFMVYLTGGLAMGTTEHTFTAPALGVTQTSSTAFGVGYTLGGGVEMARGAWGVRLEGVYVDLGTTSRNYAATGFNSTHWDDSFWLGRLGVSYKIGGGD